MQELNYKVYITDVLKGIAESQFLGLSVAERWYDLIDGNNNNDGKTEAEIALENFYSDI